MEDTTETVTGGGSEAVAQPATPNEMATVSAVPPLVSVPTMSRVSMVSASGGISVEDDNMPTAVLTFEINGIRVAFSVDDPLSVGLQSWRDFAAGNPLILDFETRRSGASIGVTRILRENDDVVIVVGHENVKSGTSAELEVRAPFALCQRSFAKIAELLAKQGR